MNMTFTAGRLLTLVLATALPGSPLLAEDGTAGESTLPTSSVTRLLFDEEEPGTGVYPVRYLVNDRHLRIDDGHDASDYILLDRTSSVIYSISHEYSNVLVINRQPETSVPGSLLLTHEPVPDTEAPAIAGRQPQHYRYLANGEQCYEAVLVPGLMQAAIDGLAEYEHLLARQQAAKLDSTPAEMRTPCFLSRYIYAPGRHLAQGLPIRVWDNSGYRRELVDFAMRENVPGHLFDVPPEYQEMVIGAPAE